MSDLMKKENSHNTPMRYGYQHDFGDLINRFLGDVINFDYDNPHMAKSLSPKVEIEEKDNSVVVCAEVPGMKEEDIDLEVSSDGYLTISGEKKQEKKENHKGSYFSEISYGSFKRTIPLPWDLNFDEAKADYKDGVLQVTFPKSQDEKGKKKKIAITHK